MNFGDFKRRWTELMGDSVPTLDTYLAALREAGLVKATGRGQSASDISFDDALNVAIAINAARSPEQGPELVRAIRKADLADDSEAADFEIGDSSFAAAMHALAINVPWPANRPEAVAVGGYLIEQGSVREQDEMSIVEFGAAYPLRIDFLQESATVEILMQRVGKQVGELPDRLRLVFRSLRKPKIKRRREIGRDLISRCDWWLPYILRHVIDASPVS